MPATTEHWNAASGTLRIRLPSPSRTRILAAARPLLRDGCYLGFSMDKLARASGLSRQTLYNQFADRDALYRESRGQLLDAFVDSLPRQVFAQGAPAEAIEHFVAGAFQALARPEHVELSRSVDIDAGACAWIAEIYARRVARPLADAVYNYLELLGLAGRGSDAAARADDLVTMMRASVRSGLPPMFTAAELAALFLRRALPDAAPASRRIGSAA